MRQKHAVSVHLRHDGMAFTIIEARMKVQLSPGRQPASRTTGERCGDNNLDDRTREAT
jgi:hypothetical protein